MHPEKDTVCIGRPEKDTVVLGVLKRTRCWWSHSSLSLAPRASVVGEKSCVRLVLQDGTDISARSSVRSLVSAALGAGVDVEVLGMTGVTDTMCGGCCCCCCCMGGHCWYYCCCW